MKYIQNTKYCFGMVTILLCILICGNTALATTPKEAFEAGSAKVSKAKTLQADFTLKGNGQNIKGKIYSKGKKFAITSNNTSNWYNGKDLYTYDASANETYLFTPTTKELTEVNPLVFLNMKDGFKIVGSKTKKEGIETVVLIPEKSGSGLKSVTIDLNSKTYLPETIKIVPSSGGIIQVGISNVKLNENIADSTFEYPKTKYPGVEINDMR